MIQQTPPLPLSERLRSGAGRRTLGLALALLIEALLLLALLTLGEVEQPGEKEARVIAVDLQANEPAQEELETATPEPQLAEEAQRAPERPPEQTPPPIPSETTPPLPPPAIVIPKASEVPTVAPSPPASIEPAPRPKRVYGPPNAPSAAQRDTERVGTAPNGEPLYAAAWYRKPRDDQLRDYLSTATGPGWGLIACRTVAEYRVEDCVALDEYPNGSQINRAILAAAWEFRVRPPSIGGRSLVGSWVRIRIDYSIKRR